MQYNWDESRCPKKDTKAWEEAVRELHGDFSTTKSPSKLPKGKKSSSTKDLASAAAKNAARASEPDISKSHPAKKQKTSTESPSGIARVKANVMNAASKLKEAPQVLGQAISDALPNSSKKISTSKPTVSTGTTGTAQHLTQAAQKAQEAIQAMSPARGSGTGSKGQANKRQDAPSPRRASARHLPQTVTAGETDENVDIDGEKVRYSQASGYLPGLAHGMGHDQHTAFSLSCCACQTASCVLVTVT